jgi:hypothetical protein
MEPLKTPGIFPSSYHNDNITPGTTPGNPVNVPPSVNTPNPEKKGGHAGEMALGIAIGIFQIPLIIYILGMLYAFPFIAQFLVSGYSYYIIFLAILIIEAVVLSKKGKGRMASGIMIGTILIPILAFGACMLMLTGMH